jgi:hypothetical protein
MGGEVEKGEDGEELKGSLRASGEGVSEAVTGYRFPEMMSRLDHECWMS